MTCAGRVSLFHGRATFFDLANPLNNTQIRSIVYVRLIYVILNYNSSTIQNDYNIAAFRVRENKGSCSRFREDQGPSANTYSVWILNLSFLSLASLKFSLSAFQRPSQYIFGRVYYIPIRDAFPVYTKYVKSEYISWIHKKHYY